MNQQWDDNTEIPGKLAPAKFTFAALANQGDNRHQLLALQEKIHQRRAQLEQQLHDIQAMQQELDDVEQRCIDAMNDLES